MQLHRIFALENNILVNRIEHSMAFPLLLSQVKIPALCAPYHNTFTVSRVRKSMGVEKLRTRRISSLIQPFQDGFSINRIFYEFREHSYVLRQPICGGVIFAKPTSRRFIEVVGFVNIVLRTGAVPGWEIRIARQLTKACINMQITETSRLGELMASHYWWERFNSSNFTDLKEGVLWHGIRTRISGFLGILSHSPNSACLPRVDINVFGPRWCTRQV